MSKNNMGKNKGKQFRLQQIAVCLLVTAVFSLFVTACKDEILEEKPQPQPEFTREEFTGIDGSTVVIPLAERWAEKLLAIDNGADVIHFNTTPDAIANLTEGTKDIIFTTYPSEAEIAAAQAKGVEFEITPIVHDAFVFLVNTENKVNSLTQDQIRQIYSGKITNWAAVGGEDLTIMAFQRQLGSGSQSGMLRFMGETPLQQAPTEAYMQEMGGLVEAVVSPDNGRVSLGYSYYYYVNAMYIKDGVKLLAVDGVAPARETIKDGTYPLVTSYYALIRKDAPEDGFARKFLAFALSQQGQGIAEQAGYSGL
ncbi:MAG: extracellular solute-binding protein [Peptococcaceae bacterium]|nr:extracellular solute-binding protein [Peptococcaceae bacterium]